MFSDSEQFLRDLPKAIVVAGVPGLVFSLIENHQNKYTHGIGVKNTETKEPVAENTIFRAVSLSKPGFAYGVLSLSKEGRLDLAIERLFLSAGVQ